MEQFYLFDYLKNNTDIDKSKLDLLKHELDQRIYYYGQHFKYPREKDANRVLDLRRRLYYFLKDILTFYLMAKVPRKNGVKTVVSNAYFSVNEKLAGLGLNVLRPMHNLVMGQPTIGNFKILKEFIAIDKKIRNGDFNELLSGDFFKKIDLFIDHSAEYYKSIRADALIVPNDAAFFEQLNIKIFKKLGKPSFIFLHGLPGRYNIYDENQTDFLIVWGKKIKQNYVDIGFDPEKIIVSGHPFYEKLPPGSLRYGFDDILIISKSLNGAPHWDGARLTDRGNLIVYLNQIKDSLEKIGVKRARLRVHPSENIDWYFKFIDQNFFTADNLSLQNSLKKSTLVIGPTSTVFLESIYYGVNYLVYEPTLNNIDISGYAPVPPFDGLDPKVPVTKNEVELQQILRRKTTLDRTIFNDYIDTPFNIRGTHRPDLIG